MSTVTAGYVKDITLLLLLYCVAHAEVVQNSSCTIRLTIQGYTVSLGYFKILQSLLSGVDLFKLGTQTYFLHLIQPFQRSLLYKSAQLFIEANIL